jgi:hypothetical protein
MAHKHYKRETRQTSADERQHHRDNLTNEDQIDILDKRLGKGIGAKKERLRLNNVITTKAEEKVDE